MRISLFALLGLSVVCTAVLGQVETVDSPNLSENETILIGDVGLMTEVLVESDRPAASRGELLNAIQLKWCEMSISFFDAEIRIVTSRKGSLRRLKLTVDQQNELERCISKHRTQAQETRDTVQAKLWNAKSGEEQGTVYAKELQKIGEMLEKSFDEFKPCLSPHQVESFDRLMAHAHFGVALTVSGFLDVSFTDICSAELDLSEDEERKFEDRVADAMKNFEQRIADADAKQELRKDLIQASPQHKRIDFENMLGEDPNWIIAQLTMTTAK